MDGTPGRVRLEVGRVRIPFYIRGVRAPILSLLVISVMLLGAVPASAACLEAPAPKVDWRRCLQDGQDLRGANLSSAVLRDASFARADLRKADLSGVEAPDARFTSAELAEADFSGAVLRGADFTRANLARARLAKADLRGARFFRADLTGADLTGAIIAGADLSTALLGGALWVDGTTRCAAGSVGSCR